jgi:dTDP-4-amino-4,6-dideoxygalactose transaminase
MADMDAILELAKRYNLKVIEDACQAHGAEYYSKKSNAWKRAGSMGDAAAFSFYPGKNLGACGEGGAATTNDQRVAQTMKMLRDHGQSKKYYHDLEGYNGRLDSLQAGLLSVKLPHLEKWNEQRRARAKMYNELLGESSGMRKPFEPTWSKAVYHLYIVQVDDREKVQTELSRQGIGTGIHYPIPLHFQKAYASKGYKIGDFPVTERLAPRILSLPMFPTLTGEQQARVVEALKALCEPAFSTAAAAAV